MAVILLLGAAACFLGCASILAWPWLMELRAMIRQGAPPYDQEADPRRG